MRFWWHVIKVMWRHVNGRWYVWRDSPDDIVREVAGMEFTAKQKEESPNWFVLVQEAKRELQLREARFAR
jgi:hypothetical protein